MGDIMSIHELPREISNTIEHFPYKDFPGMKKANKWLKKLEIRRAYGKTGVFPDHSNFILDSFIKLWAAHGHNIEKNHLSEVERNGETLLANAEKKMKEAIRKSANNFTNKPMDELYVRAANSYYEAFKKQNTKSMADKIAAANAYRNLFEKYKGLHKSIARQYSEDALKELVKHTGEYITVGAPEEYSKDVLKELFELQSKINALRSRLKKVSNG